MRCPTRGRGEPLPYKASPEPKSCLQGGGLPRPHAHPGLRRDAESASPTKHRRNPSQVCRGGACPSPTFAPEAGKKPRDPSLRSSMTTGRRDADGTGPCIRVTTLYGRSPPLGNLDFSGQHRMASSCGALRSFPTGALSQILAIHKAWPRLLTFAAAGKSSQIALAEPYGVAL